MSILKSRDGKSWLTNKRIHCPTIPLKNEILEIVERDCTSIIGASSPFTPALRSKVLSGLHNGKAAETDMLRAGRLEHANPRCAVLLHMLFNAVLTHGCLPSVITYSTLIPVIKDKAGDPTSKANYRLIALLSCRTKALEKCILTVYSDIFSSTDHQYGFKAKHSTDLCILTLKKTINFYLIRSNPLLLRLHVFLMHPRLLTKCVILLSFFQSYITEVFPL